MKAQPASIGIPRAGPEVHRGCGRRDLRCRVSPQVRWRASADPDRTEREEGASPVIDFLKFRARACIADSGWTDTPPAQGSRPTYPVGVLGGVDACVGRFGRAPPCRLIPPSARQSRASRFLMRSGGCQDHWPSCGCRLAVIGTRSRETPSKGSLTTRGRLPARPTGWAAASRAGGSWNSCRVNGPTVRVSNPANITDGCCPYGSTQVPSGAEPIVLHRDAVSGRGYFMLGAVVSADMDLIGQLQPNTPTKFAMAEMDAALSARKDRSAMLDRIRETTA